MRRLITVIALLSVVSFGLVGCGSSNSGSSNSGTSSSDTGNQQISTSSCPTDNTKAFPKARFAANVGLIVGSFHHWIWKPYQAGTFKKGAKGRTFALVKAGATALFIKHELGNAISNAKSDPSLCKLVASPLSAISGQLDGLVSKIRGGDFSTLLGLSGAFSGLTSLLGKNGMPVTETHN